MRRLVCLALALSLAPACGSDPAVSPTLVSPSPTVVPAPTPIGPHSLSGEIRERRTEHGARIPGARVEIASGPDTGRFATSDSLGQFLIDSLAAGDVTVRVTKQDYVEEVATAAVSGNRQIEIRLTPADARFEGHVFDATSGLVPLEGASVDMVSGPLAGQTAVTNIAGQYVFTGVYGSFTVRASKPGYTTEERSVRVTDPIVYWNFGLRRQ